MRVLGAPGKKHEAGAPADVAVTRIRKQEKRAEPVNVSAIHEVLNKACRDEAFSAEVIERGSRALAKYRLTWEEKAAIVSGDIRWLEKHAAPLNNAQRAWLNFRLQQERW